VAIPEPLRAELDSAGLVDPRLPAMHFTERVWCVCDGDADGARVLWRQPFRTCYHNWGLLWQTLRAQVTGVDYRVGALVTGVEPGAGGARVVTADGQRDRFDLVIGADGYRSVTRAVVDPDARPAYAGYGLWRGSYPVDRVADLLDQLGPVDRSSATVAFPRGHGLFALVPDTAAGHRMTWAMYYRIPDMPPDPTPADLAVRRVDDDLLGFLDGLVDRHFPARYAELIHRTARDELMVQPVFDLLAERLVAGRVLLMGDAAAVTRPHAGAGATKALQEALALGRTWGSDLDTTLAEYESLRAPVARSLVGLGRRIGGAQVEHTPDWPSMTPADFDAWMNELNQHTFYSRPS
jgi:2-polyprenyl-6-methoxyphenol hydroxylase-like FAD-dependent oxidoreductase